MSKRSVKKQDTTRGKESGGVGKKTLCGFKRGDMDDVDGNDQVRFIEGEMLVEEVHLARGEYIGEPGLLTPGFDAVESAGAVRGLPGDMGKAPGEGDSVLSGSAAEFKDSGRRGGGEQFVENVGDRRFVTDASRGESFHGSWLREGIALLPGKDDTRRVLLDPPWSRAEPKRLENRVEASHSRYG